MTEIPNTLFSETQRKELSANEKITKKQKDAIQKWKDDLDSGVLDIESQNKDHLRDLMIDALGYPREKIIAEKGNMNTRLDYSYTPSSGKNGVLFELKSRKKKLFEYQGYDKKEQSTPIDQAIAYIEKNQHVSYAVVTNFEQFVLLTREDLRAQCYKFTFPPKGMKLLDSEIKEFVHFFSKDGIESGFIEKAKHETIVEEITITDDFYKLFHQTRLMLIHAFQEKKNIEYNAAITIAQTYLNRLIFLLFAEDNDLIKKRVFTEGILSKLNSNNIKEKTTEISDYIQTLFRWMDSGDDAIDNKHGFNGEFFKEPIDRNAFFYDFQTQEFFKDAFKKVNVPNRIKLNQEDQIAVNRYGDKISPIIVNFLKMAAYDFRDNEPSEVKRNGSDDSNTQISVNILGHIFEQSIGDLEELHSKQVSKRKKDGVFYTPEYITRHICKTTIIPYLSKNGATEPHQLVLEYKNNIQELEDKINQIKIVDPACGSGAFLVKAVDVLISIYDAIQNFKQEQGAYTITKKGKKSGLAKQLTFDKESEAEKARGIIKDNIYGVDINTESVEITKLSLFLKIASKNKRLIGLSQRIMVGNSLIDDKAIDERAFDWKSEFQEILNTKWRDNPGFDVIIGNPPYIRVQFLDHKHIDWFKKTKETAYKRIDASGLFFELGKKIIKKNGVLSFIVSNQFVVADYGLKTREFLLKNFRILDIIDFGWLPVFEDALTYVSIFNLENNTPQDFQCLRVREEDFGLPIQYNQSFKVKLNDLDEKPWRLWDKQTLNLLTKLDKFPKISSIGNAGTGLFTGLDEVLLLTKDECQQLGLEKEVLLPVLTGSDSDRYAITNPQNFVIYPYELKNNETVILNENVFEKKFPKAYNYVKSEKNRLLQRKDSRKTFEDKKDWFGLTRFGKLDIFKNPKIITPGEVKQNKFTIDNESGFLNARIFCIVIHDKKYNLYYVLGMLNSKTVQFYLHKTAPLKQGGYFGYGSKFLNDVPIPLTDDNKQNQIIENVAKILKLKEKLQNKIDEFLELLKINLSLKITKKMTTFYTLEFEDLVEEFSKQKLTLTLEKQSEWRKFFSNSKNEIHEINTEIQKIENTIEELTCIIYDLSSDEKLKILEN